MRQKSGFFSFLPVELRKSGYTNQTLEQCPNEQVLGHYKGLLDVEEAFCELKSYLEVRPIDHRRTDRVINHVRP